MPRLTNAEYRNREHLFPKEIVRLRKAASGNRYGHRDDTAILLAYQHALRASELCGLEWTDIDFDSATIHLRRRKGGIAGAHPLTGEEMRALRKLKREQDPPSRWLFATERGGPF